MVDNQLLIAADAASVLTQERWNSLPQELTSRRQWCLAGRDKEPLTLTGGAASVTNPSTWFSFEAACAAAIAQGLNIGYVLTADDPLTCIDLDVKNDTPDKVVEVLALFEY